MEYGKVDIGEFDVKSTPLLWYSFITGLNPSREPLRSMERTLTNPEAYVRRSLMSKLVHLLHKLHIDNLKKLWRIATSTGVLFKYVHTLRDYQLRDVKTIFDVVKPSIALFVPTYTPFIERKFLTLTNAIGNPRLEDEYTRIVWRNMKIRLRVALKFLRKCSNWKLFMVHFFFTDQLGHLYRGNTLKMFRIYIIAARIARLFKKICPPNTLFLIVSDHGMKVIPGTKYGDHSDYGFYSVNIPLGLGENIKIYDFTKIMKKLLACDI
ncbi:MAG: hypothetical protein DRZ82_08360 [Thermoprotei archaeon]|nr:MAG: hypothetical protein DRZ82_08360 [Thermoprotei archaeon]